MGEIGALLILFLLVIFSEVFGGSDRPGGSGG